MEGHIPFQATGPQAFVREASEETFREVCAHFGPPNSRTYCAALTRQLSQDVAEILGTTFQKNGKVVAFFCERLFVAETESESSTGSLSRDGFLSPGQSSLPP